MNDVFTALLNQNLLNNYDQISFWACLLYTVSLQFELLTFLCLTFPHLHVPHQVQRNCCLTLCNFSIPEELEFQYSRVNQLLLKILEPARQDESIQRIAVHLCNALVCQVDNHHKEAVGKMGFVKVISRQYCRYCSPNFRVQPLRVGSIQRSSLNILTVLGHHPDTYSALHVSILVSVNILMHSK